MDMGFITEENLKRNCVLRNVLKSDSLPFHREFVLFREFLYNHQLVRIVMKNPWIIAHFTEQSENPSADTCIYAQCCGCCKIELLTASVFSSDLLWKGMPILRFITVTDCLNIVTHETIDFWSKTGPYMAVLNQFSKMWWLINTSILKVDLDSKNTYPCCCSNPWRGQTEVGNKTLELCLTYGTLLPN